MLPPINLYEIHKYYIRKLTFNSDLSREFKDNPDYNLQLEVIEQIMSTLELIQLLRLLVACIN